MSHQPAAPHVVIIGGYLTEPIFYRPMRRRLLERGAVSVAIAPLHLPDWLAMFFAGMGPVMLRGARVIRETRRTANAPLLVIGHSAGGIVARLAMAGGTFEGRRVCVSQDLGGLAHDVGCLVTLGTPHRLLPPPRYKHHAGVRATEFLALSSPGAHFAPATGYLTVASTRVPPAGQGRSNPAPNLVNHVMRRFVGGVPGRRGDGLVDDEISRLDGARHLVLPDVLHGTLGGPWYGDCRVIDRWWPAAVEEWRAALAARAR